MLQRQPKRIYYFLCLTRVCVVLESLLVVRNKMAITEQKNPEQNKFARDLLDLKKCLLIYLRHWVT